jgi:hypothetical protein
MNIFVGVDTFCQGKSSGNYKLQKQCRLNEWTKVQRGRHTFLKYKQMSNSAGLTAQKQDPTTESGKKGCQSMIPNQRQR